MPVTSRKLIVHQFSGAGKKAPTNLKWNVAKQKLINIKCNCFPDPITIQYTIAGTYTYELPTGYSWQISGTLTSGGGGGGGGAGGFFAAGGGGKTNNILFTIPVNGIFPGGSSVIITVGAGGAGGAGASSLGDGSSGSIGSSSSFTSNAQVFTSAIVLGGIGGFVGGLPPIGEIGGTVPGSSGSGGNGGIQGGSPGSRGKDGSVIFTATPLRV